ncbi:hypothetical protein C8Q76DRAFT_704559 [Earliella scabrosa]|nr:hypothetical protein C8Q76DRAFT_704559 [Earliella scabrosa]
MLKLVDKDSDQYRIFQELMRDQAIFRDYSTFPCVLPPTRILDTPHQYAIVAMPMWGQTVRLSGLRTVREAINCMTCLLDGLTYLHSKRIAHRDICEFNILTNCYRLDQDLESLREDLRDHWTRSDVLWALMDYDQSIQHPENVSLKQYRRPADEAWAGAELYRPEDIYLGEPTYNPFAFDVAMLGNLFRVHFANATSAMPALAALFDMMTTHVYEQRFTAQEAQAFLRNQASHLTSEDLVTPIELAPRWEALENTDVYWSRVAPHLQDTWQHFRSPGTPRYADFLAWFMGLPTCHRFIASVRRFLQF